MIGDFQVVFITCPIDWLERYELTKKSKLEKIIEPSTCVWEQLLQKPKFKKIIRLKQIVTKNWKTKLLLIRIS